MMRYFRTPGTRRVGRWGATNPYTAAIELARQRPRGVLFLAGSVFAVVAIMALLVISSAQAFLAVSQTSNTRARLTQGLDDGASLDPSATGAEVAVTPSGAAPTGPVAKSETTVVYGIRVHISIAGQFRSLMDAAKAEGVTLSGWGWRDHQSQIRLRRKHCGTSRYAIYDMPSSRCSPPTARPGRSQHELGLAIDFTYNGRSISTRRNAGFRWLNANAGKYGFKNLASEPWHWSTTGR